MEFSRQESWGGQPFPCPEDLLGPWKEPRSAALPGDSLSEPPGKPHFLPYSCLLEVSVYQAGPSELSFFCLFILFMGFSRQEYWSGLPFPSPIDHSLSKLPTMTCLSWVAHEIKRCLFLGRKAMTNLDSILKSRDITLTTKVHLVKASFSRCERKLSTEELMLLNCGVEEDSWESLGLQGDPSSPS